jgi:charged multivesicular body protein 4
MQLRCCQLSCTRTCSQRSPQRPQHKKVYENEIDNIENIKMTLETQVMNLGSAAQNAATFAAMNAGKDAMAGIRQDASIDKVGGLVDENKEEMDRAEEISHALAQQVDPLVGDGDALLAELQEREARDVEEQRLATPAAALPALPRRKLPKGKNSQEAAGQLEAELAGMRGGRGRRRARVSAVLDGDNEAEASERQRGVCEVVVGRGRSPSLL